MMQTGLRRLLFKNLSVQTLSEAVAMVCGLLSAVVLSRHLEVEGFGAFNYAFAFMYLFLSLNDLGVNTIVIREVSQAPERAGAIIGSAIALRLLIAGVVLVAAWIAIWTWPMEPSLRVPLSLFALVLPLNALNVPGLIFITAMRFDLNAAATVIWRVSGLLLVLATVAAGFGVTAVLGALLISDVIGLATVTLLSRRLVRFRIHVDRPEWRRLLQSAAPVGASLVLTALVNRIDFVMLEHMASLEAVGLYSAAYRITNMLEKFPLLVMATIYPIMSQLASADRDRLRHVYRRTFSHFAAIGLPIGLLMTAIAPQLTAWLFGEEYRDAGRALRFLVWSTVCLYLALAGGNLLISIGRARDNLIALCAGAFANISLNLLLIPTYGIAGAAFATAVSFFIVLVITVVAVERVLRAPEPAAA